MTAVARNIHCQVQRSSTLILGVWCSRCTMQMAHVGVSQSRGLKLFGREIIFEKFQPMWSQYLNVTLRQTDGRLTMAIPRFACTKVHRAVKTRSPAIES